MEDIKRDQTIEVTSKTKKKKKKKFGAHQAAKWILIIGIIIILIPCGLLGYILIQASKNTGKPVSGSRFEKALDPQITETESLKLESSINSLSNVEKVEVNVINGQLRIMVDCADTLESSEIEEIAKSAFKVVDEAYPANKYFDNSTMRMYDLSIYVYNFIDSDNKSMICWNVQKNSQMELPSYVETSKAISEELAKELRGEVDEVIEEDNIAE